MIRITIEVSSRHVHLNRVTWTELFGRRSSLHRQRAISQTGQFAARETVTLIGPRRRIPGVRIVGPLRKSNQVELSATDARFLGCLPPLRDSGDLRGAAPIVIAGPRGRRRVSAAIIQRRHIHASPADCRRYRLRPGTTVRVKIHGPRALLFDRVYVKVDPSFVWALHLDTDEANAARTATGDVAEVFR